MGVRALTGAVAAATGAADLAGVAVATVGAGVAVATVGAGAAVGEGATVVAVVVVETVGVGEAALGTGVVVAVVLAVGVRRHEHPAHDLASTASLGLWLSLSPPCPWPQLSRACASPVFVRWRPRCCACVPCVF